MSDNIIALLPKWLTDWEDEQGYAPETREPTYKFQCLNCNWMGYLSDLRCAYKPNPLGLGDVVPTPVCPHCDSEDIEERKK